MRESRAEAKLVREEEIAREGAEQYKLFHGHRTTVQVCPRGCGFHERARRDLLVETSRWGRANVTASVHFETTHCPRDGAKLVDKCARCARPVFAPVADRCQFCGVPQPWAAERRAGAERASTRHWRPEPDIADESERLAHAPAQCLYRSERPTADPEVKVGGDIWVIDGDISRLAVDAVISNDDVDGQMWSQSARSIKNAAGHGVERLAQEGKPFSLGQAWTTSAGDLQMKNIIHVASMNRYGVSSTDTVRECLDAALCLAVRRELESVALTAFGTGPAAIEMNEWFEVFAETAVGVLSGPERPTDRATPLAIVLVLFARREFEQEVRTLRAAVQAAWEKHGEPADGKPEPAEQAIP